MTVWSMSYTETHSCYSRNSRLWTADKPSITMAVMGKHSVSIHPTTCLSPHSLTSSSSSHILPAYRTFSLSPILLSLFSNSHVSSPALLLCHSLASQSMWLSFPFKLCICMCSLPLSLPPPSLPPSLPPALFPPSPLIYSVKWPTIPSFRVHPIQQRH